MDGAGASELTCFLFEHVLGLCSVSTPLRWILRKKCHVKQQSRIQSCPWLECSGSARKQTIAVHRCHCEILGACHKIKDLTSVHINK